MSKRYPSFAEPPLVTRGSSFSFVLEEVDKEALGTSGTSVTSVTSVTSGTPVTSVTSGTSGTPGASVTSVTSGTAARLARMPSSTGPIRSHRGLHSTIRQSTRNLMHSPEIYTFTQLVAAMNGMLEHGNSKIKWFPDKEVIKRKSDASPTKDYLFRSTDYEYDQILKLRNDIIDWIESRELSIEYMNVLVVDVANAVFAIQEKYPSLSNKKQLNELHNMLQDIQYRHGCNVIILSIQNHYIEKPEYYDFISKLQRIFGINIFIITAHNRASSDDLNGVLTIEILRDLYIDYKFLTGDYLMDYLLEDLPIMFIPEIDKNVIDPKVWLGIKVPLLRSTELENHFRTFKERRERERERREQERERERRERRQRRERERERQERERRTRGGTNKNKYTRKIKNSKKVKTLHKKRNTSKKVLKKYNKNYKKKTLRRKNK